MRTQAPSYELAGAAVAEAAFLRRYPGFDPDGAFARLRRDQYGRLDRTGHVYLDYTGGGLHADGQIAAHAALLSNRVLGNPHSNNPASVARFRQLLERRDMLFQQSKGPGFSELSAATDRYGARVQEYYASCAGRPMDPGVLAQARATGVCPPPY